MDHEVAKNLINRLVDQELNVSRRRELLDHMDSCSSCREEYERAERLRDMCLQLPLKPLPQGFKERLDQKIQTMEKSFRFPDLLDRLFSPSLRLALITTAVILILVGLFMIPGLLKPADDYQMILSHAEGPLEHFVSSRGVWKVPGTTALLRSGDRLRTDGSRAVITTTGNASIRLSSGTEVEILRVDRSSAVNGMIRLDRGKIWIEEGDSGRISVASGNYTIQPVGTVFTVSADTDSRREQRVEVFEGMVLVNLNQQRAIDIEEGERFRSHIEKGATNRTIEKIDPGELVYNEWYQWNQRVESTAPIQAGKSLETPRLADKPISPPQWANNISTPLSLPSNDADWENFKMKRTQWRTGQVITPVTPHRERLRADFARLPDDSRAMIISHLKFRGILSEDYPPMDETLPEPVLDNSYFISLMQEIHSRIQPSRVTPQDFAALPLEERKIIIRALKDRNILPSNFSEDSKVLPSYAFKYIGQQWENQGYHRLPSNGSQK